MTRRLLPLALLLPLLACGGKTSPSAKSPQPEAAAVTTPCADCYTLKIVFHGLMGFAKDPKNNKVWAFLVKTDNDPNNPRKEDYPPGVFDEAPRNPASRLVFFKNFPKHVAKIRFSDAEVTGCDTPEAPAGCDIGGEDISFETDNTTLGAVNLDAMSDASFANKVRNPDGIAEIKEQLENLDFLDSSLTEPLTGNRLDPRLTTRVSISAGDVLAQPFTRCGERLFSYNKPRERPDVCNEVTGQIVPLAEEVIVTQSVPLAVPTVVNLAISGKKFVVKPKSKTVTIEIVNQTPEANESTVECPPLMFHGGGFRWLYTLAANSSNTNFHFFPCLKRAPQGGDKCPPKSFVIKENQ